MEVVLVLDEFLVDLIGADSFRSISNDTVLVIYIRMKQSDAPSAQKLDKVMLELTGEISYMTPGVLSHDKHLAKMCLGLGMALETVLISTLLLTDLTVPPQAL
jgi:hypothetical protein